METYRLKNIAIFILLLLNLWLLVLLGFQYLQTRQADSGVDERLRSLYEAGQLALAPSVDALQDPMPPLALSRRVEAEALMAAALLGEGAQAVSQGGGIYSYSTEAGSIQFRSGGSFDGSRLEVAVEDIAGFSEKFCSEFGYRDMVVDVDGGTGSVTAATRF